MVPQERLDLSQGNFYSVLLSFPIQLHFYKFPVPYLDQPLLWQRSYVTSLDVSRFVSLCHPDVCPSVCDSSSLYFLPLDS